MYEIHCEELAAAMTATSKMESPELQLKLRAFCDRIGANYRDARYVLAHGMVPEGVKTDPGRGKHRVFGDREAFWLAILLKLKAAGIKPKLAAEMASWSERIKEFTVNSGWDWRFSPFDGRLATEKKWCLEVGDASFVRFLTTASPTRSREELVDTLVDETGWVDMNSRKLRKDVEPTVTVRIDLSLLARQLASDVSP